jgi:hypothetical protein
MGYFEELQAKKLELGDLEFGEYVREKAVELEIRGSQNGLELGDFMRLSILKSMLVEVES